MTETDTETLDLSRDDLPEEVLAQLKKSPTDELLDELLDIIDFLDQEVSIDDVIIAYYRRHQDVLARPRVRQLVATLAQREKIVKLPQRSAIYMSLEAFEREEGADD